MHGEVIETIPLTPTMVRVVFGGEGLADFTPSPFADQYVNALFLPDGAPYEPPFDLEAAQAGPAEHRPRGRRYTIRWWDPETRTAAIDFVVHGDIGLAGRWASNARPGDRLQMVGPSGGYNPHPDADWYLMIGDESAMPAIAASLERVRAGAPVTAVLVVDGPDFELPLETPGDLSVRWIHRSYSDQDLERVVGAVAEVPFQDGQVDVFVHGEAAEVRATRKHLLGERKVDGETASISPYWRRGETDEIWREHKREWVAEMLKDVA